MSTLAAEAITSPGHELAACALHVAELLNQFADAAESSQPEAFGSWMGRVREIHASVRDELMTAAVAVERAAGASWTAIGAAQDSRVSRQAAQQPRTVVSVGGMWAADDRRDVIRANDYPTSGAWLVIVEGVTVGSVRPQFSSAPHQARDRLDQRYARSRWLSLPQPRQGRNPAHLQDRAVREGRRRHLTPCATPPA